MRKKNKKPLRCKIILRLPDLDHSKNSVLNSLSSELQQPAPEQEAPPPPVLNSHDLFKARAIDLQLPCQLLRPDAHGGPTAGRVKGRRIQDKATTAWNFHPALYYKAGGVPWRLARQPALLRWRQFFQECRR